MTDIEDVRLISNLGIDILIVIGWQRLVPKSILESVRLVALGIHGSADGITKGRGRSPQNWALYLGATNFTFSLFELTSKIDDGRVISSATFELTQQDDIKNSYLKLNTITKRLLADFFQNPEKFLAEAIKQEGSAEYYPARLTSDGQIDWQSKSKNIHNLVRAITYPYPGAYTFIGNQMMKIWKIEIVEQDMAHSMIKPGEVLSLEKNRDLLIKTSDGVIKILDYEIKDNCMIRSGTVLKSSCEKCILDGIIRRHRKKYPNLKISTRLLNFRKELNFA